MTPYPNIYGVIPSPAMVTVSTGRGMVLENCTCGIPVVNPMNASTSIMPKMPSKQQIKKMDTFDR